MILYGDRVVQGKWFSIYSFVNLNSLLSYGFILTLKVILRTDLHTSKGMGENTRNERR